MGGGDEYIWWCHTIVSCWGRRSVWVRQWWNAGKKNVRDDLEILEVEGIGGKYERHAGLDAWFWTVWINAWELLPWLQSYASFLPVSESDVRDWGLSRTETGENFSWAGWCFGVAEPPPCKLLAFAPKLLVFRHGGAPSLPAASFGSKAIFFYRFQKATLEIECLRQSPMKPSGVVFRRGGATSLRAAPLAPKAILLPDSEKR